MASSAWSPPSSSTTAPSLFFLSPVSPYDKNGSSNNLGVPNLPAPLLSSSPVRRRRTSSLMNNSLDLAVETEPENSIIGSSVNYSSGEGDSGYFNHQNHAAQHHHHHNQNYPQRHAVFSNQPTANRSMTNPQVLLTPSDGISSGSNNVSSSSSSNNEQSAITSGNKSSMSQFAKITQFLHYRTELLVAGQQATPWNHFTIVGQLRKLENLNLIDRSLIRQDNPQIEVLTLVQKLVKYNLAMEMIDGEDEQLRHEQLAKLIKLRCEEVLAISGSIQEITERRHAIYVERCRIRVAMKELAAEIAMKTQKSDSISDMAVHLPASKPLICL